MSEVPEADAIRSLIDRSCEAVRHADREAFAALWAPEGRWTGPDLECEGIHAIVSTFATLRARVAGLDQQIVRGSATVAADGTHAIGSWEIHEHVVGKDGSERDTAGRYDDEYVRGSGEWRFRSRHFTPSS